MVNIKSLVTYGFAEANLLSRKTKLKTYRRSLLRGKLDALSKKSFFKWLRQSHIRVNPCNPYNPRNPWLISSCLSVFVAILIMQNKPKFPQNRPIVCSCNTRSYKNTPPFLA